MSKSKPTSKMKDVSNAEKLGLLVLGCRYDVILRVSMEHHFSGVAEHEPWTLCWSDVPLALEKINDMKRKQFLAGPNSPPIQKFNHFPGMYEICRKDRLCRNLNRLRRIFPQDFDFFPSTWDLPSDMTELLEYGKRHKNTTYIVKPDCGCQGKGIFLVSNLNLLCPFAKCVCQLYITQPFLIDGYKFDQRIYVLVTCVDPLRFYIHSQGIARFATVKYQMPSDQNMEVTYMHLTNWSLNKFSDSFDASNDSTTKRPMSEIYNHMRDLGYDVQKLKDDIDEIVVKTVVGVAPMLRHSYRATFPKREKGCNCFEVLGFDILVDRHLKPFLIEVNHSPSFNLDTQMDTNLKFHVVRDLFAMLYFGMKDHVGQRKINPFDVDKFNIQRRPGTAHATPISEALKDQFAHEENIKTDFRLIFSEENPGKYSALLDKEYFLQDYEDDHFVKKRPEPCMYDGSSHSEPFHKGPRTVTSFRQTQYGQVYVESRTASPVERNHHEFLTFKYNSQFTESGRIGKRFRSRSRKKKSTHDKNYKGAVAGNDFGTAPINSTRGSSANTKPMYTCPEAPKISPSQRVQIALEQLRKTNVEKFKAIKETNMFKYYPEFAPPIVTGRPISPYLYNSCSVLSEKLRLKSAKADFLHQPMTSNSIYDKNDSILYLDTSKLPSVFKHAMQATQLQRDTTTTRVKTAVNAKALGCNEDFYDSNANISLNNAHQFKPFAMDIMEERERLKNSSSGNPAIEIFGIGAAAQKVVEMVAPQSPRKHIS